MSLTTTLYNTLPDINPILIELGPVAIRWYALAYVAGIVVAWYYIGRMIRNEALWNASGAPITHEHLDDLILWLTGGIILGGRIGYVVFYMLPDANSVIWSNPLTAFAIWDGGMAFHGGLLGVVVAAITYSRLKGFDTQRMLSMGDLLAASAPIGLLFGRLANFINGELWGRPTDAPWGMVFCNKYTIDANGYCAAGMYPRHPSQLYEAFLEGLVLLAVLWWLGHHKGAFKRPGLIMGVFLAGYGLFRALLETVRNPDAQMPAALQGYVTMGMLLSLPMIAVGVWLIQRALKKDVV